MQKFLILMENLIDYKKKKRRFKSYFFILKLGKLFSDQLGILLAIYIVPYGDEIPEPTPPSNPNPSLPGYQDYPYPPDPHDPTIPHYPIPNPPYRVLEVGI